MKAINFTVTEQLIAKFKALSQETGLSMSELVRRAMEQYLRTNRPAKG